MSIENAIRGRAVLLERVGKSVLNIKYPKEFELYVIALELIDGDGNVLNYFIFPVNPSSLDELNQTITNVRKTQTGVTVLKNPTFVPIDINISGTFGRKFRILLGTDYTDFLSSFSSKGETTSKTIKQGLLNFFDERVKTGFGCLNVLKDILDGATIMDSKGPRLLILHNLPFGSAYVVEPISTKTSMSQESNMIHNYNLALKAVAPLAALKNGDLQKDRERLAVASYVQSQTDRLTQALTKIFQ
jgi:hypothetical protein